MTPSERLKGIEAFVATADAGSFTAAAMPGCSSAPPAG